MKIADISKWQGTVDWEQARSELDFVILRASCGVEIDLRYQDNANTCGVPFGVYHYVKAGTTKEAEVEAQFFVESANKANIRPNFYIADIEHESQTESNTEAICVAFLNKLRELGCPKVGLYINQHYKWAGSAIEMCDIVWIPRYGKNDGNVPTEQYHPKYECDIWQYTSKGKLAGVNGDVDLNILMGDKPLSYFTEKLEVQNNDKKEMVNMAVKIPISKFVEFLNNRYLAKDGYIMGATGQDPSKWAENSWWFTQYSGSQKTKALYWRKHAKRVWDCQGLSEGYYKDVTGIDVNTRAKYNYANWCSVKGSGKVPSKHKVPGLAVFKGDSASSIHHVGYLVAPVKASNPTGDWYIIEAKGVMYGVVKTKLNSSSWTHWGYMDKYFDYSEHNDGIEVEELTTLGYRTLRKGDEGSDVVELQKLLIKAGYKLPKYGADGDFGEETLAAVKAFQKANNLTVDGIVGKQTFAALEQYEEKKDETSTPTTSKKVVVTGDTVNVRPTGDTSGNPIFVAKKGEEYEYISTKNNWHEIKTNKGVGWISGKYSKIVEG